MVKNENDCTFALGVVSDRNTVTLLTPAAAVAWTAITFQIRVESYPHIDFRKPLTVSTVGEVAVKYFRSMGGKGSGAAVCARAATTGITIPANSKPTRITFNPNLRQPFFR
jgi:hypothetical protein